MQLKAEPSMSPSLGVLRGWGEMFGRARLCRGGCVLTWDWKCEVGPAKGKGTCRDAFAKVW